MEREIRRMRLRKSWVCWIVLYSLYTSQSYLTEVILNWEKASIRSICKGICLISDRWRKTIALWMALCLWLVFPGSLRKQTEETMGSKPVSNSPPWPLHQFLPLVPALFEFLSDFLWWITVTWKNRPNNPFHCQITFLS